MDPKEMEKMYNERAFGHAHIWKCTQAEFIKKVSRRVAVHQIKNHLSDDIIKTAMQFLCYRYKEKQLFGEIEFEVIKAIEESLIYHVNIRGEKG